MTSTTAATMAAMNHHRNWQVGIPSKLQYDTGPHVSFAFKEIDRERIDTSGYSEQNSPWSLKSETCLPKSSNVSFKSLRSLAADIPIEKIGHN